jgi:hypothetical protein
MRCRICGKNSKKERECPQCTYFLKHGADEETIKATYVDDETNKVWQENKNVADELAEAYYDSLIDNYPESQVKKSSKEEFGFNTFSDGIRVGLDIIMPLLNPESQKKAKAKIAEMVAASKIREKTQPES